MRALLVAGLVVASTPASATGPGQISWTQTLIGWSEDGQCYAILRAGSETHGMPLGGLEVHCGDARKLLLCGFYPDGGECGTVGMQRVKETERLDRVDVESDPRLRAFALKRIAAPMRAAFAGKLDADLTNTCKDEQCDWRWRLKDRATGKVLARAPSNIGLSYAPSGAFVGGYLHPSGDWALLKFQFTGQYEQGNRSMFRLVRVPRSP